MHGCTSEFVLVVNAELNSMGGVGISSTPSLQQLSDLEKTQAELRQTFTAAEKFRRELEFLQKGGDPLDLKPGKAASISFQSTSLTDRHPEQFVTSETKGSFAITASPHGDSVESSGRLGAPSVCEPNSADNLMLLKESGESAVLELPKKAYKRRIRSRPNRDPSRHATRDFKGLTHDADKQERNYLLNSNSNPISPNASVALKNSTSHRENELDVVPAAESTLGPAHGPYSAVLDANAFQENQRDPTIKSDGLEAPPTKALIDPESIGGIEQAPLTDSRHSPNGFGNTEEIKIIPDPKKVLDAESSCTLTIQHFDECNGNGLSTTGPMEQILIGNDSGAEKNELDIDPTRNVDGSARKTNVIKGPESAIGVDSDDCVDLKAERKQSISVEPDFISQDGNACNRRPNETPLQESTLSVRHSTDASEQYACTQDNLKLAVREHEDSVLEEARIIEAKRKRIAELSTRMLPLERRPKSQWDFVLEEMSWLANDFAQERLWKVTAAAQISQRVAYASRVRFQQQSFLQKHKEVSHTLAEAVLQFWHMIQAECKGSKPECFKKDIALGVQGYAARFLEYNSSQAQLPTNQAPAPPDSISDIGIIDCSWEDNLTEENLFYMVPPGAIEAYRKAIDSHLQQFERTGSSMQEEVETSGYDAVADNAFEEDEGETSTYYLPGGFEGIKSTKTNEKRRQKFTLYGPRSYEMGGDLPYMPPVERTVGIQPSVLSGKRYGSNLNVGIPTKRVRTASRQRIISPFNVGTSGHIQVPNRTDASSGDNNSFQDEQSILHGGSQMPNNMEVESVGDYEKQLHFDSMEVSNRPKKKKKGSTFDHRWQLDSNFQNDQKDHSRRLDTHQFDSNGSSVASQMSNMSNPNKFMKLLVRDRGRKVKAPKTPVGQPGSGSPWSLFEDQALVVLVHDMGPNWELISDAINSTLQFKCIFRKSKECKERHKILMDRNNGDGADSAEDSGSSQPYPSTLPGIPEGTARQLFQRLQGPMEEDTLKSHFEKIITIGQKQHYRTQNDNQDPKQLQQPHSSHAFALSQVCPNNLNSGHVLTPLQLEAVSSSPDGLPVGYQGPHSGGLPAPNQGAVPTMLPGSTSSAPGSSNSVHANNLPPASAPHNPSSREGRYGIPRTGSLSVDDQQRLQQYNQMINARNAQQSSLPPGSHSVNDRGVRILPAGNGAGVMGGVNRNIKMARPGYQGTASTSILNSGMATSSSASMHAGPGPGQGNSMLRPRDPMHMVRPNQNTDQQVSQSGATQAVPPFSSGTGSSFPNPISQHSYAHPVSPQRSPHVLSSNSHHSHHFQGPPNHATNTQHPSYVMRIAKERHLQQQRLLQQQTHFSTPSSMMSHVQQTQESQLPVSSPQNSARSLSPPVSISPMGTPIMTPKHPVPPPHGLVRNPQTSGNQVLKQQRPRLSQQFQHAQPRQKAMPQQQAKLMKAVRGNMIMNQNLSTDSSIMNGFTGSPSSVNKGLQSGHGNLNAGSSQAADKQSVPHSLSQPHQQKTFSGQIQKPIQLSDNGDNKNNDPSMIASSTNQQQPQGNQKLANRKQTTIPQKVLLNRKFNTSDQSTEKQDESLMVLNTSQLIPAVQIPLAPSNDTDSTRTAVVFSSIAPANAETQLGKSSVLVSSPQTNSVGTESEHSGLAMNQDTVHRQSTSDSLPNPVEHDGVVQQQQPPS
uniref:chromatin modification-related protein EAF1 B-like isoform X2 n=1 Tax=Erigeron canadensis TaxID=72917 RepID=UPI001CB8D437|nr:chromatin modification-related protein EAF1 B-like isoform X2 [Erigeron canadensis]